MMMMHTLILCTGKKGKHGRQMQSQSQSFVANEPPQLKQEAENITIDEAIPSLDGGRLQLQVN